jgi:type III pantothenate kinase
MNTLLVDCGNSRVGLALLRHQDRPVAFRHLDHAAFLEGGVETSLSSYAPVSAVLMASVAPVDVTDRITRHIEDWAGLRVRHVRPTEPVPFVRNGYRKPEQLGVDRLMAMVAARSVVDGAVCVVDAGTAVTVDLVDTTGQHLGGLILPGERLARGCLLGGTAIPDDPEVEYAAGVGRDTATAVRLGSRYAVSGAVAQLAARPELQPGMRGMKIVVGGGNGASLLPMLPAGAIHLPDLVLHGLAVVAHGRET